MEISIISMVLTAVLVLSCLFLIISPFFKWDAYIQFSGNQQDSSMSKEALLTTLNEIEFEYKMDKISESDYKKLKKQYELEVSKLMKSDEKRLDKAINADVMAEVEREIEEALSRNKKKEGVK
jgi:hypothetical protein